ncbi:hypothetical protein TorRG33x02_154370 [Trema orientale]|uniref:Uncharacterized protein n=1 Tax=Trema orientale TaxID=63057 RepID=A0A2P5ET55_TREOI|nr:hypothetical protein TorRG33x02_154370 [Trema orientale]
MDLFSVDISVPNREHHFLCSQTVCRPGFTSNDGVTNRSNKPREEQAKPTNGVTHITVKSDDRSDLILKASNGLAITRICI